jgi:hypothetical protein
MAITLIQARKLLTAAELEVFIASRGQALTSLSLLQLRGKVKRARSLSEKYRDLLQRQKLATQGRVGSKTGRSGVANARTEQKAVVFGEVLESFTRRLAQVEAAQERASQKAKESAVKKSKVEAVLAKPRSKATAPKAGTTPRSSKAPAKEPVSARSLGPTSESARVARHARQPKQSGHQNVHAHIAARGRRNQAKRDSRG